MAPDNAKISKIQKNLNKARLDYGETYYKEAEAKDVLWKDKGENLMLAYKWFSLATEGDDANATRIKSDVLVKLSKFGGDIIDQAEAGGKIGKKPEEWRNRGVDFAGKTKEKDNLLWANAWLSLAEAGGDASATRKKSDVLVKLPEFGLSSIEEAESIVKATRLMAEWRKKEFLVLDPNEEKAVKQLVAAHIAKDAPAPAHGHGHEKEHEGHWTYSDSGSMGPKHWGDLKNSAAHGTSQSPIDIVTSNVQEASFLRPIHFHYNPNSEFEVRNNGHTLLVNVTTPAGQLENKMQIGTNHFKLLQFHFHTKSEHTVDGEHSPMELHLVHELVEHHGDGNEVGHEPAKADAHGNKAEHDAGHTNGHGSSGEPKKLAVIGVMIEQLDEDAEKHPHSDFIRKVWRVLPSVKEKTPKTGPGVMLFDMQPEKLLPPEGHRSYYRYHGSLTTPPCTESVMWTVLQNPVYYKKGQIEAFEALPFFNKIGGVNNRPVQPLHARYVLRYQDHPHSKPATPGTKIDSHSKPPDSDSKDGSHGESAEISDSKGDSHGKPATPGTKIDSHVKPPGSDSKDGSHGKSAGVSGSKDGSHGKPPGSDSKDGSHGKLVTSTPLVDPHWDYGEGNMGPDNWYKLKPEWRVAGTGKRQSPINIKTSTAVNGMTVRTPLPLQLIYKACTIKVVNNGHTIQANLSKSDNNVITLGGERYKLIQFHFHHRSEHKIDDKDYPMELHLVHAQVANPSKLAVIGVMIQEGAENPHIKKFWKHLPQASSNHGDSDHTEESAHNYSLNPLKLIPLGSNYFQYEGSLTTPPCTENVYWTVMQNPINFSAEQIKVFSTMFPKNNRNVQKAFNRLIRSYNFFGN